MLPLAERGVNATTCLTKTVVEIDSLPQIKTVVEGSEWHMSRTFAHLKAKGGLEVPLTRKQARGMILELARDYGKASKKQKSEMLAHVVAVTGYTRSAAARALRSAVSSPGRGSTKRRAKRGRKYGPDVIKVLRRIWAILDFLSGKRLAPFLPEIVPILERHGEISVDDDVRAKLMTISASTIDRALKADRQKFALKGRSGTKPGSLLKSQIPIRTFSEWDDARPGFIEIDLVEHNGGNPRGEFACTLDAVDIATRWTETRAVRNKAQRWVFEALMNIIECMPFALKGIDSDNGSEFINNHFIRFCRANSVTFTRSRPNKKNDSCYVEQKNWSLVRVTVGYARYDTQEQTDLLNRLYAVLRLYSNYFQPVMTLASKERNGSKVTRRYDEAKTPYQRAMLHPEIPDTAKEMLKAEYRKLNPASLKRQITHLQAELAKTVRRETSQASPPEIWDDIAEAKEN